MLAGIVLVKDTGAYNELESGGLIEPLMAQLKSISTIWVQLGSTLTKEATPATLMLLFDRAKTRNLLRRRGQSANARASC